MPRRTEFAKPWGYGKKTPALSFVQPKHVIGTTSSSLMEKGIYINSSSPGKMAAISQTTFSNGFVVSCFVVVIVVISSLIRYFPWVICPCSTGLPYWCRNIAGIILCMRPAKERWCYIVTSPPIGCAHTQNGPWDNGMINPMPCPSGPLY